MKLRPYQIEGADWLVKRSRAMLADAPRVGKTPTAAHALNLAGATSALVLCPAIVKTHWRNILRELAPNVPHEVMSYDKLVHGGEPLRSALYGHAPVSHLILDEFHHLSQASAQRTQLVLGRDGYASRTPVVWALSGTPEWKHRGSLWTTVASLFGRHVRALGIKTTDDWYNTFTNYTWEPQAFGPPKRKVWSTKNDDLYKQLLAPIMLRRKLSDTGMDVPPLSWGTLTVDVPLSTTLEPHELLAASRAAREWIDGKLVDPESVKPLASLRHSLGIAKVPAVVEHVKDLVTGGEQVAVFAHHTAVLDALQQGLREQSPVRVDGSTPERRRWRNIEMFNNGTDDGHATVFIGQNHAVKEGIPLHAANTALIVEPDWTANVNHQLSQRIVQLGQHEPKVVQFVASASSIDEALVRQHIRETEMQEVLG